MSVKPSRQNSNRQIYKKQRQASAAGLFSPAACRRGFPMPKGVYQLTSVGGDPQKGAVAGDYTVTVNKVEIKMVKVPASAPGEEPQETAIQKSLLHKNYLNAKTTPLKATVIKGKNQQDFALTKNGGI
jgi:hypothetical protein